MKGNRFFKILAAAVILSLLMIAIPITPALGAPLISLSTSSGYVGDSVTVTGLELTPGETYTVTFAYGTSFGQTVASGTVSGTTLSRSFAVPAVPRDSYTVRVVASVSGEFTPSFTVSPEIVLEDDDGYVGDTVTVNGTGFGVSKSITLYYGTTSIDTDITDSDGTFEDFTFTIPASTEGNHTVKVQETVATTNYATDVFTVIPKITIDPTSGAVDVEVTITGTGFESNSDITVYFDSSDITDDISGDDDTNSSGSFECTFDVPEASRGSHTVKVQDEDDNYATATFTVSASITIDPESGPSGTTVTVTGTGFGASKTITIKYNDTTVTTDPTTVTTNSAGYFTADFDVPVGAAGTYEVEVSDGTTTVTADFESITDATISQTTTTSAPGNVGMTLTITGVGFLPSHEITITYASDPVVFTTTSLADGSFSYSLTVPASEGGAHTITVTDGVNSKVFDFVMESNPPAVPVLVSPLVGEKADSETVFDWSTVQDVSPQSNPVTYDLQLATSDSFSASTLIIDETGLTESTYTILPEDKLESTGKDEPYYWRVRAVDAASNASAWSATSNFYVGWSFEFTGWVVYVAIALAAVIFFFLGLWLGRRSGGGEYY
jgi:hypothetical protein